MFIKLKGLDCYCKKKKRSGCQEVQMLNKKKYKFLSVLMMFLNKEFDLFYFLRDMIGNIV